MAFLQLTTFPWYYLIPISISLLMLVISVFAAKRCRWAFICTNAVFLALTVVMMIITGSIFLAIAVIFYGLMIAHPLLFISRHMRKKEGRLYLWISVVLLMVSGYAMLIEPFWIEVTEHHVILEGAEPMTVVQLADIQTDYLSSRERQAVKIINEIKPDLIVISGDYYNGQLPYHKLGFDSARYMLENMHAPYGVYGVSSDTTHHADHPVLFEGTGAVFLENQNIFIKEKNVHVVGISRPYPDLERAFVGVAEDDATIVVYHGPEMLYMDRRIPPSLGSQLKPVTADYNPSLEKYGMDLLLVGHTHGGQISVPFIGPLTSGTLYGRGLAKGSFRSGGTTMYVNRGLGMEGWFAPKIRFLTRPEIAVFHINS